MVSFTAILAFISEKVTTILASLFTIFKLFILIILGYSFFITVKTVLDLVSVLVNSSVIGEFFHLVSMFLPFDASVVFGSVSAVMSAILSFIIARKIFNLYKETFAAA